VRAADRIDLGVVTMITAHQLLRQWDAGQPVWSWKMDGHEHRVQCMAFEILRWFITRPSDLEPLQRLITGEERTQFVSLLRRLEAIPAIRNMQPYSNVQLAKALVLARALFNYDDAGSIPADRRIRVRRLVVVAA
jgi:hypothetical protein